MCLGPFGNSQLSPQFPEHFIRLQSSFAPFYFKCPIAALLGTLPHGTERFIGASSPAAPVCPEYREELVCYSLLYSNYVFSPCMDVPECVTMSLDWPFNCF